MEPSRQHGVLAIAPVQPVNFVGVLEQVDVEEQTQLKELRELQQREGNLKTDLHAKEIRIADLERALNERTAELEAARARWDEGEDRRRKQGTELFELREENVRLRQEILELKGKLGELQNKVDELLADKAGFDAHTKLCCWIEDAMDQVADEITGKNKKGVEHTANSWQEVMAFRRRGWITQQDIDDAVQKRLNITPANWNIHFHARRTTYVEAKAAIDSLHCVPASLSSRP